jgi:REP element-mobilizing transposase RayT
VVSALEGKIFTSLFCGNAIACKSVIKIRKNDPGCKPASADLMIRACEWCLLPGHLHMIVRSDGKHELWSIIRDFKKFTSRKIIHQIIDEPESRRECLLDKLAFAGKHLKSIKNHKFWQSGNHAEVIYSPPFFYNKLDYIHKNPVYEMIVTQADDYLFSSARNYAERDYLIEIIKESPKLVTI